MNFEILSRPKLFEKGSMDLHDNEYIAQNVINRHLDYNVDSGSRRLSVITKSVDWISDLIPKNSSILDVGCGVGIYAKLLSMNGHKLEGVDISPYSIQYAKDHFQNEYNPVSYICSDILEWEPHQEYDTVLILYALYSFFDKEQRLKLLKKLYNALKRGGKLVIEVFGHSHYRNREESRDWEYIHNGGFWRKGEYLELNAFYRYDAQNTVLIQTAAVDDIVSVRNLWIKLFSPKSLNAELEEIGITNAELYSDVCGSEYIDNGDVICAVITKT